LSITDIGKPFARWESLDACVLDQEAVGHDKESATKICLSIEERAEKGMLYKSAEDFGSLEILKNTGDDLIVGGPASWDIEDPVHDHVTTKGMQRFLEKFFNKVPAEYRNVSIDHGSLIIGKALLKYPSENPRYWSHVHEKGMYLISKIRSDDMPYVNEFRARILGKEYKMYSIRGRVASSNMVKKDDGELERRIDDIDPIEVAIVKEGMCPMPKIEVLKDKELPQTQNKSIRKMGEDDSEVYCVADTGVKASCWVALCDHHFNQISKRRDTRVEPSLELMVEAEKIFRKRFRKQ
jgi:hypothetical protein